MAKVDLTAERLREVLHYDPETGVFTWKTRSNATIHPGTRAGSIRKDGRRDVGVDNRRYLEHRLAWLYMIGAWPTQVIDHRDGNATNNTFSNLRDVSQTINLQNIRSAKSSSTSGVLGAKPRGNKWRSRIRVNGRRLVLGTFDTPQEAHAAYIAAKRVLHAGCTI